MTDLPLTPDDVADIIALLDGSAYETLELATPRFVLKLARSAAGGWTQDWRHSMPAAEPAAVRPSPASAPAAIDGLQDIYPPLPGTFYRAPRPGAPPFVSVGDVIGPDSIIGIIETMKVMNSIVAQLGGEIVEILASDGEMVGKDRALIRVRPT